MSNIEFILDGQPASAAPGETILEAARKRGIAIPTLCNSELVSKNTSCLVCVVRDEKTGRFIPSCTQCPAPGQQIDASGAAVQEMRRTALELLLSEHSGDCEAPCTVACPAHAAVEEYVRAGREGDWLECLRIVKERIPLPMSIGRVCPRFCEKECRKNLFGAPVAINDFKRYAADRHYTEYMEPCEPETGKKVALVGAGPAGLSAAYFLRRAGVAVKIFDQMPEAGGMLRYGIPEYRLPKRKVLDVELAHFRKMGVEFEFNRTLGKNLDLAELTGNFDAVGITVGCWQAGSMRCAGEEFATQGIDFLRAVALADNTGANPGKVIVVGGGNTAMDCLRTCVRLGSPEVHCFYRRTENEMPAEKIEIREAREEGVHFEFLIAPIALRRENGRLVLTCQRMALGEPDASGRRRPVPQPGSEFDTVADTVIAAIGQNTALPPGIRANRWGCCEIDETDGRIEGKLFAAGDCVSGAATVVEAVAGARRMALGMIALLTGRPQRFEKVINVSRGSWRSMDKSDVVCLNPAVSDAPRVAATLIEPARRCGSFDEVMPTIPGEAMQKEGQRCIECSCSAKHECHLKRVSESCGACVEAIQGEKLKASFDNRHATIIQDRTKCIKCGICVKVCQDVVNQSLLAPHKRGFNTFVGTAFDAVLPTSCTECGACVAACPTGALDWKDKRHARTKK